MVVIFVVGLEIDGPAAVITHDNGNLCDRFCARESRRCPFEFAADAANFVVDRKRRAIGADERAVVLLLAVEGVAPLPIEHCIRTVTNSLPGHSAGFAGIERVVDWSPVHRTGLRLHHPEVLTFPTSHEVMHGAVAGDIQMAFAYVVVPGGEIKRPRDLVVIPIVGPSEPANVGGNELARIGKFANGVDLHLLEVAPRITDKSAMVEQKSRVAALRGEGNLVPPIIGLAPVGRGPIVIKCVERSVFSLEPVVELAPRARIEGLLSVFIADLPADHIWIVSEAMRELLRDGRAEDAIFRVRVVELPATAVLGAAARGIDAERLGMSGGEPCGGRVGGSADDNLNVMLFRQPDRALKPVQVVAALRRLQCAPGKLAHANDVKVCILHQLEVRVPARLRPLFGIPG